MQLQPTVTFEQYHATCEAVAGAKQRPGRAKVNLVLLLALIPALAFTAIPDQRPLAIIIAVLLALSLLLPFIGRPWLRRQKERCYRKLYDEEQMLLNHQKMTIKESGIDCELVNGSASWHYQWAAFSRRLESTDAWIFLSSPNTFVRVPKTGLAAEDTEQIEKWSSGIPLAR